MFASEKSKLDSVRTGLVQNKYLYENSSCCVRTDKGFTDLFAIVTGVRQGCILSPLFFSLIIDFIMRKSTSEFTDGIKWNNNTQLNDLDFADDIAAITSSQEGMQDLTSKIETEAAKV